MEALSAFPALCEGNPTFTCGFPSQSASNADFGAIFDASLNE